MSLNILTNLTDKPDFERALVNYRELASGYDASCGRIQALRLRAVRALCLQPGEIVFDIACGTGALLPVLARAVGSTGHVVGVELSPDMATLARRRVAQLPFREHISVVQCPVEEFTSVVPADALLFSYAHDVLQSPMAIDRLIKQSKPAARVAVVGMKTLPWMWGWPVNCFNLYRARSYLTTYGGLDRPWRLLEDRAAQLHQIESALCGSAFITVGQLAGSTPVSTPPERQTA
ncbi:demethylmenaquinone methyltransferase / 2-methoxy-6-polyprenyl-1,4-benzoquinol methylase [Rhodocyclaceae bacterium]|nr:demethylmenaquinone methyltransferase / 2-methoxy-6-polyprenyl-1,4-benzoquinol methylase [Rhodocyclaceae bacterium]